MASRGVMALPSIYSSDPTYTIHYDRTKTSNPVGYAHNVIHYSGATGGIVRAGARVDATNPIITQKVKVVQVFCTKFGNPSGNISVVVRKGTDDTIGATIGTFNIQNVIGSEFSFVAQNDTHVYATAVNDVVSVEYTAGGGNNTDGLVLLTSAYQGNPALWTGRQHNGTSWANAPSAPALLIKGAA
jgi:hypothetical protein